MVRPPEGRKRNHRRKGREIERKRHRLRLPQLGHQIAHNRSRRGDRPSFAPIFFTFFGVGLFVLMLCFVFHVARAETRHTAQLLLLFIIVFSLSRLPLSKPSRSRRRNRRPVRSPHLSRHYDDRGNEKVNGDASCAGGAADRVPLQRDVTPLALSLIVKVSTGGCGGSSFSVAVGTVLTVAGMVAGGVRGNVDMVCCIGSGAGTRRAGLGRRRASVGILSAGARGPAH